MYIDKAKIFIKSGDGGNGTVSFYTEKFISNGGPDGGDGGKGGDIIFEADSRKTTLIDFKYASHFKAGNGERGASKFCTGKQGEDLIVKVPRGTIIRDFETDNIIADMFEDGHRVTVLKGGLGGKGNSKFKSSRRQAPFFAQCGVKTEQKAVTLELKTIADIGLVGFPNVGKSTLLSVISAAKPKIANYHFTTLSPNLGVVSYYGNSFCVADIPGLIEGAGEGAGLGHDFLRHIDRTRLIVHVIDISGSEGRNPVEDYRTILKELKTYSKELAKLPSIIALNKADITSEENIKEFKRKVKKDTVLISAATRQGIDELIAKMYHTLETLPKLKPLEYEPYVYPERDTMSYNISRFDDGAYCVSGGMIDEFARNVILDNYDSFMYFQKRLKDEGVITALRRAGAKQGDTVRIMDIEFDFVE
ncbi:developmentally regulated gtp-binding protein-related [Holotrichia oblita]|nr:developmentally regulated gtp-binding protein-related [Holotrichia oblita]